MDVLSQMDGVMRNSVLNVKAVQPLCFVHFQALAVG